MFDAKQSAFGSPEKRSHSSNGVIGGVNKHKDNDVTHGLVNAKHINPVIASGKKSALTKEKWTPKTTGS
eukprot:CAMPEP_0176396738 /NCGR_PEP_ID=MMETSP0126-20121128/44511_1 /TAXON_ID=141414 ORGANISM="Strombidinopsis acuminatum, Strain SPMC142" /NCGR_SAMPLE_ID=MMETSP0126 /ASSEMBLY_ACC=CAM_ASM_000229 /LENGTH=68 /DNA_ID=CAMNT_0017770521 /DNA_START=320 /DNA_END=522 /DNA_ORIENTATION=+